MLFSHNFGLAFYMQNLLKRLLSTIRNSMHTNTYFLTIERASHRPERFKEDNENEMTHEAALADTPKHYGIPTFLLVDNFC